MLSNAVIIEEHGSSDVVGLGSRITVKESGGGNEEYLLVGAAEANPREGRISNESPLGRALLGRRVGDEVKVQAPAGPITFRVVKIRRD
jgi:transcription elongation factor GreA